MRSAGQLRAALVGNDDAHPASALGAKETGSYGTRNLDKIDPRPIRSKGQISDSDNAEEGPARCLQPCAVESVTQQRRLRFARSRILPTFSRTLQIEFGSVSD
jgi:hypothetical protein